MLIKLTKKMHQFIKDQNNLGYVATCNNNSRPNIAPKALLDVGDDSLLYADLFMDRTAENIFENNEVAIAVINPFLCTGYQFKGRARIITKGNQFDFATIKFKDLGFEEPVHAIKLLVDEIFHFDQGPDSKMEAA